jgi:hypothetical protein
MPFMGGNDLLLGLWCTYVVCMSSMTEPKPTKQRPYNHAYTPQTTTNVCHCIFVRHCIFQNNTAYASHATKTPMILSTTPIVV